VWTASKAGIINFTRPVLNLPIYAFSAQHIVLMLDAAAA
jgi:hypothetical protein